MMLQPVTVTFSYNPNANNFKAAASDIANGLFAANVQFRDSMDRDALCDHIYRNGFIGIADSLTSSMQFTQTDTGYKVRIDKRGGNKSNNYVLRLEPFKQHTWRGAWDVLVNGL